MKTTRSRRWLRRLSPACLLGFALLGGAAFAQGTGKKPPRMYEGYPPVIPHDVQGMTGGQGLACHGAGLGGAPIAPHPSRTHFCLQCHVGQDLTVKPFPQGKGG